MLISWWKSFAALFRPKRRTRLSSISLLASTREGGAQTLQYRPQGVEVMHDTSQARWIEERLWPWGRAAGFERFRLGCLLPEGFPAYACVLHPASVQTDEGYEPVRWSTVASWTERTVRPQMQFALIADLAERRPYQFAPPAWGDCPRYGSFPPAECRVVAEVLKVLILTPGDCYFCVWEG